MTENCIKCGCELIPNENWPPSYQKRNRLQCNSCYNNEERRRWRKRYWQEHKPENKICTKKGLKDRTEILLQNRAMDIKELYNTLKEEFGNNYGPNQQAFTQICIADRQHRFIYKNKTMRLRTALEIQEYLVEHEIVGVEGK